MKGRTLVIIPCGASKVWDQEPSRGQTPARDVYTGAPFKLNRQYAEKFGDRWVILSAKYGFIDPDFVIPGPYNVTFKDPSSNPIAIDALRRQAHNLGLASYEPIIVLGGADYANVAARTFEGLPVQLKFPFAGLPIGLMMQAVKKQIVIGVPERPSSLESASRQWVRASSSGSAVGGDRSRDVERAPVARARGKPSFDEVWRRIGDCQGQVFHQIRGQAFTYELSGSALRPSTTNQNLPRGHFEEAYRLVPLQNTTPVQHLRGPSYLYAILMDAKVRRGDW